MKLKKVAIMFLATLIALSMVLTSCGTQSSKESTSTNSQSTTTTQQSTTQKPADEAYTGQLPLVTETVTLKFATHQGTSSAMAIPSNDLPVYQYLEKTTNVHIEWDTTPFDTYKDVMTTRFAAKQDLPDVINLNNLGNYEKLADDGIIIPQTELVKKYGYYINKFFDVNPAYKAMMTAPNGEIYCVEDTVLDSHLTCGMMINKYALQRVGLSVPETTEDFYNMLKAFKEKDINGNGKKDEVPLATIFSDNEDNYLYTLGNAFGLELTWGSKSDCQRAFTIKDGKMVCQYQLPEFKQFLSYVNKLYSEGLINKDMFSANYDKLIEYTTKGQCGVVGYWTTYAYLFGGASADNQGDKDGAKTPVFVPAPPLKTASGSQYFTKRQGLNGDGMGISTSCPEEKKAIAMKWIDFLFNSPEALMTQTYGVEGLSYKKNADGTIEKIAPEGKEWSAYVTEIGGNQPPRAHQQQLDSWRNSWLPKWLDDVDQSYQKYYVDPSIIPIQWKNEEQEKLNEIIPDFNTYVRESVVKFILGKIPLDKFDDFVKELDKRGVNDIKTIYQARYDRQKSLLGK